MAAHALVGVCWAVFYAYFFWAQFDWQPAAAGPRSSAPSRRCWRCSSSRPQLRLMQLGREQVQLTFGDAPARPFRRRDRRLAARATRSSGSTVGAIYTHPVGYPADRPPDSPSLPQRASAQQGARRREQNSGFHLRDRDRVQLSDDRARQLAPRRDARDAALRLLAARLRAGARDRRHPFALRAAAAPDLHRARANIDWDLVDEPMAELRDARPGADRRPLPFRSARWLGDFQNPDIAAALAEYARRLRRRAIRGCASTRRSTRCTSARG